MHDSEHVPISNDPFKQINGLPEGWRLCWVRHILMYGEDPEGTGTQVACCMRIPKADGVESEPSLVKMVFGEPDPEGDHVTHSAKNVNQLAEILAGQAWMFLLVADWEGDPRELVIPIEQALVSVIA